MFMYAHLLRQVPMLKHVDGRFLEQLVLLFKSQVSARPGPGAVVSGDVWL